MIFIDDQYLYLNQSIKYLYEYLYESPYYLEYDYIQGLLSGETDIVQWEDLGNNFTLPDNFLFEQNMSIAPRTLPGDGTLLPCLTVAHLGFPYACDQACCSRSTSQLGYR